MINKLQFSFQTHLRDRKNMCQRAKNTPWNVVLERSATDWSFAERKCGWNNGTSGVKRSCLTTQQPHGNKDECSGHMTQINNSDEDGSSNSQCPACCGSHDSAATGCSLSDTDDGGGCAASHCFHNTHSRGSHTQGLLFIFHSSGTDTLTLLLSQQAPWQMGYIIPVTVRPTDPGSPQRRPAAPPC